MGFMKRIVVWWALLQGLLSLAQAQGVAVSAALSLEHNQLLPDEKMYLKLTIENRSGQDLMLGATSDWITFTVQGEKNSMVPEVGTNHVYIEGETTVPPGLTASRDFNLTPYFDFRQPGHYTVKATVKFPQWPQGLAVTPVSFSIVNGIRLANQPPGPVGVTLLHGPGNQPPPTRNYILEKSDDLGSMKLYVRLTDASSGQTVRLVPLGLYFSYSEPDVKLDRFNDLHVLHQTDAKAFSYCVIDTLGQILERRTYQYTDKRPALQADGAGGVAVAGGTRVVSASDLPPPERQPAATPVNASFPGSRPGQDK